MSVDLLHSDCSRLEAQLSAYLDGELETADTCEVMRHLEFCAACGRKLEEFRHLGAALRALPAPAPPPLLALRVRAAASRAGVGRRLTLARMRLATALRTLTVPVAVGMGAAVLAFAAFYGNLGAVLASNNGVPDVALMGVASPPRLLRTADTGSVDAAVLVEAQVDANGRVYGYRVLSGPRDGAMLARLNNQLLFSVFQPAMTAFGEPVAGSVLVSYGTVHVRG